MLGATTKVAALKKALSEAEDKAAKECIEREKQEARVGEVQQELQALAKKHESLERDPKTQGSELAKALESAQHAKAEGSKKGRTLLPDNSTTTAFSEEEWLPRDKPLAKS